MRTLRACEWYARIIALLGAALLIGSIAVGVLAPARVERHVHGFLARRTLVELRSWYPADRRDTDPRVVSELLHTCKFCKAPPGGAVDDEPTRTSVGLAMRFRTGMLLDLLLMPCVWLGVSASFLGIAALAAPILRPNVVIGVATAALLADLALLGGYVAQFEPLYVALVTDKASTFASAWFALLAFVGLAGALPKPGSGAPA